MQKIFKLYFEGRDYYKDNKSKKSLQTAYYGNTKLHQNKCWRQYIIILYFMILVFNVITKLVFHDKTKLAIDDNGQKIQFNIDT